MKTIVCYGDSNTWGHKSFPYRENTPSLLRYGEDERWTGLLQARLGGEYRVEEEGLNGRTTMFDDPLCDCRNGLKCIDYVMTTKYPVDMVILMLGTNDTKSYFNMSSYMIARGAGRIIERIQQGAYSPDGGVPEILLVSPIRLNPSVHRQWLASEFGANCLETDAGLAENFRQIAEKLGVHFMDAGEFITADENDGVHMSAASHALLAEKMLAQVKAILG